MYSRTPLALRRTHQQYHRRNQYESCVPSHLNHRSPISSVHVNRRLIPGLRNSVLLLPRFQFKFHAPVNQRFHNDFHPLLRDVGFILQLQRYFELGVCTVRARIERGRFYGYA